MEYGNKYLEKPFRTLSASQLKDIYFGHNAFEHLWVGPHIPPGSDPTGVKTAELKRAFREHNLIREVVDNWKDALISKPFNITLKAKGQPVESEKPMELLNRWIDKVNGDSIQSDPRTTDFQQSDPWQEFVLALGVLGSASLRLWQHPDVSDPLQAICLHVPRAGTTQVNYDEYSFIESIEYSSGSISEKHTREGDRLVVTSTNAKGETTEQTFDTGGAWFIQVMEGVSLITDSAISKEQGLCHDMTMFMRNQQHAGFKRRTLLNAELPDEAYEVGPGIDEYLPGIPSQTIDGEIRYTTPSVHESQPFPVSNFDTALEIWTRFVYREYRQIHLLDTASGNLSWESRVQMRATFQVFLERWSRRIESAFSQVLTLVLRMSGYSEITAVVDLNIITGMLSSEERKAIISEYQAGLLSLATTISLLGSVSDVPAEIAAIAQEAEEQATAPPLEPPRGNT